MHRRRAGEGRRRRLVEVTRPRRGLERTGVGIEVLAGRHRCAADLGELRGEGALIGPRRGPHGGGEVPVPGPPEAHALALALDHQSHRDALHPAGTAGARHPAPEHRRDLVPDESVEDASAIGGLDESAVDVARRLDGLVDRLPRDLVEDHPTDVDLRLEDLEEVPGDGLPLAILVGGEVERVRGLQRPLDVPHDLLGTAARFIPLEGEVVLDVDAEPLLGQVAHVAVGGEHGVVVAEEAADRVGLGLRLDDHEVVRQLGSNGFGVGPRGDAVRWSGAGTVRPAEGSAAVLGPLAPFSTVRTPDRPVSSRTRRSL
jgi:hypothetical protein